ncbi:DUF973 family protein [Metallosphaera tengchongensis]|uniref:DUF973 family protein n=1 Tax=Metallosphaera tengchongensis TaxID=1532350 RepID=A0A6N0NX69_9CREN|nr:DUF973 family protein [Metallosphaera tengchongensis]QKR00795.1 DUF973 family protein [Metallosphaera tengchongensis]
MAYSQEFEAFRLLRGGIVFEIVAALLAGIGIISVFVPSLVSIFFAIIIIVLAVIFAILALIRMYRGFSLLQPYVNNMNLGKIGVILAVIPILNFVGTILIGVSLYLIGDKYNNGTLKIGGILTAIPFGLITFIGLIISYVGLGSINPSLSQAPQPQNPTSNANPTYLPPQPTQGQGQPQVYQVGQGTIKGNMANFTLYSSARIRIDTATLEGTNNYSVNITPVYLQPGNNVLTVTFAFPVSAGGTQRIRLVLENGSTVYVLANPS